MAPNLIKSKASLRAKIVSSTKHPARNLKVTSLLDLPLEIRCMIWKMCRPEPFVLDFCSLHQNGENCPRDNALPRLDPPRSMSPILLLNRQVSEEAHDIVRCLLTLLCKSVECVINLQMKMNYEQRAMINHIQIQQDIDREDYLCNPEWIKCVLRYTYRNVDIIRHEVVVCPTAPGTTCLRMWTEADVDHATASGFQRGSRSISARLATLRS